MADLLSDEDVGLSPSGGGYALQSDEDVGIRGASPQSADSPPAKKEVPDAVRPFVGANRMIAGMAGAPVDAVTWGINKVGRGVQALTGEPRKDIITDPIGGSESIKRAMGALPLGGANPDDVRPAATTGEKVLEAAGEGAASMLVPGLGAEALLARTFQQSEALGAQLTRIIAGTGAASNTAMGAAGGALGEVAAEAVPDQGNVTVGPLEFSPEALKDAARLGGNLVGGAGAAAVESGVRAGAGAVGNAVRSATEPAELRAARDIMARAENPSTLRQAATEAAEAPPLVEGSSPTLFQATGDLGVGALEREVAASPKGVARFAGVREEQNAARLAELEKLSQPDADPAAVADYVRARLQDITDDHIGRVGTAARGVAESLAKAGGDAFDNPAAYGDALRGPLAAIHQQVKDEASRLWRAVDPDMSVLVNVSPLKEGAANLRASIAKTAKAPEGEEASILSAIGRLEQDTDFGSLVALRSRLTDAMRDERRNGTPTVLRRLSIMLDNVDDTLARTAGELAIDPAERSAIIAGLKDEATAWRARESSGQQAATGTGIDRGAGGVVPGDGGPVPAVSGGEVSAGRQPRVSSGNQGVSASGLPPEVAERYAAARSATRELKQTYESGPVGSVLAPGAQYGSFKTTASNVASKLFDRPEALQAYIDAAKGNPSALAPMQDYAAFSLRQAAVKDGMLSPAKYQQWLDDHAYAFRQFPDLVEKFGNVRAAQTALDDAIAAQKKALADYQTGAIKRLLNTQDPDQVIANALKRPGEFEALVREVRGGKAIWANRDNDIAVRLVDEPPSKGSDGRMYQKVEYDGRESFVPLDELRVSGDQAAVAGMKRAVIDFMMSKALSTAEAGTSGQPQINAATLQKFFLQNRRALSSLFTPEELASIDAVTKDLQRANRSIVAVKIPGGSNTAQDTGGRMMTVLRHMMSAHGGKAAGGVSGAFFGPVGVAAGAAAGAVADAMRVARINSIENALVEMMLDPKMAAIWLKRVPPTGAQSTAASFARKMRALVAAQVTQAIAEEGKSPEGER